MEQEKKNDGFADFKKNITRLYEMVAISIIDNKEISQEAKNMGELVRYTSYHISNISNHDCRIDDTKINLREIMGKVDTIQEELQRLVRMNQGSKAFENPTAAAHPIEEESVVEPMKQLSNP